MDAIAQNHHVDALWRDLMGVVAQRIAQHGAHPARTVVLLPYAQLMAVARQCWARRAPDGFAPRFETTRNWAGASAFEPGAYDLAFDSGRDLLTARALLARAGLEDRADALSARVVEAAKQLAPLAAAVVPAQRPAWAAKARAAVMLGMEPQALQLEAAIGRVALEWAAASGYVTDTLLAAGAMDDVDLLVVLQGLQEDPLQQALLRAAGAKGVSLPLAARGPRGALALHAASASDDEAERAAACVLRHVEAGRVPVALAATDRVLTRRVAALLAQAGAGMRDEQGWKLSTTRSAAQLMALLKGCAWDASSDEVLDWLKHAPAAPTGAVLGLERRLRRLGLREWRQLRDGDCGESAALRELFARVDAWRQAMQAPRPLGEWLAQLRDLMHETGQAQRLQRDDAGLQVLEALRLMEGGEDLLALPQAGRRMGLGDFRAWADDVLEAESFRPAPRADAPVVILPFEQTLGRPFAAIVLPGCDEQRLPPAPPPPGMWTAAQRDALGLPSRDQLEAAQRAAWAQAVQAPQVDILWREGDDSGEPLLPSPLVQALLFEGASLYPDAREVRELAPQPVASPRPQAAALRVELLSASAYEDLRRCPYRFFALRQLGLKEAEEVDGEVDKRDFGNWLHGVLRQFHESLRDHGEPAEGRAAHLDAIARGAMEGLRVEDGEFLPFQAGWPGVRDAYLDWQARHEREGAVFLEAESEHRFALGEVTLMGRIDRIDAVAGHRLLVDYKTEGAQATDARMKDPAEDTQLAFYAALLGDEPVQAAYLNVSERGKVKLVAHPHVLAARDLMRQAIAAELGRIATGEPLAALGDGRACEFCAARGLCRKDFWS